MKPKHLHLCIALVAALPLASVVQDELLSKRYGTCMDKAESTIDMLRHPRGG